MDTQRLSQEAVAEVAGVSQNSVNKWLSGGGAKSIYTQRIATKFKVPHEWLIGEADDVEPDYIKKTVSFINDNKAKLDKLETSDDVQKLVQEVYNKLIDYAEWNVKTLQKNQDLVAMLESMVSAKL